MITGIAHVNLTVPPGTLDQADAFYKDTLGFTKIPVPHLQRDSLAWYVVAFISSCFSE
jgi:catechol 2,3-dioxygenase-like lactoylglutathione lyase family enzyme